MGHHQQAPELDSYPGSLAPVSVLFLVRYESQDFVPCSLFNKESLAAFKGINDLIYMVGDHSSNRMIVILEIPNTGTEILSRRKFIFVEVYYIQGNVLGLYRACTEFPGFHLGWKEVPLKGITSTSTNSYP